MPTTNPDPIKHLHWKKLIGHKDMKKIADTHGVFLIVIKPLSPPRKRKGKTYDLVAYLHGEGSDYLGKFEHRTDCTWVRVTG